MRKPIDDSLTEDQLRRVDRWTGISLASFGVVAAALVAVLLLGGSTTARSDDLLGELDVQFEGHYALGAGPSQSGQTSGANAGETRADKQIDIRALLADPAMRESISPSENSFDFENPKGVYGFGPLEKDDASIVAQRPK